MRLMVAEPADVCRMGVHRMLEYAAPDAMVTSTATWWAVSEIVLRDPPSMLLISSDLEGTADAGVASALRSGGTVVVLLARSLDRGRLRPFLRLPISAVLREEDLSVSMLQKALAGLTRGVVSMPGNVTRQLLALAVGPNSDGPLRAPALTAREMEALRGMAGGMTNRQIARRLHITEHGAKRHVANILAKLNCPNRTMAVTIAIRCGLLPEPDGLLDEDLHVHGHPGVARKARVQPAEERRQHGGGDQESAGGVRRESPRQEVPLDEDNNGENRHRHQIHQANGDQHRHECPAAAYAAQGVMCRFGDHAPSRGAARDTGDRAPGRFTAFPACSLGRRELIRARDREDRRRDPLVVMRGQAGYPRGTGEHPVHGEPEGHPDGEVPKHEGRRALQPPDGAGGRYRLGAAASR